MTLPLTLETFHWTSLSSVSTSFAFSETVFTESSPIVISAPSSPTPASPIKPALVLESPSGVRLLAVLPFIEPVSFAKFLIAISTVSAIFAVASCKLSSILHFNVFVVHPPLVQFFNGISGFIKSLIGNVCKGKTVFLFLQEQSRDAAALGEDLSELGLIDLNMGRFTSSGKKLTQTLFDGGSLGGLSALNSLFLKGDLLVDLLSPRIINIVFEQVRFHLLANFNNWQINLKRSMHKSTGPSHRWLSRNSETFMHGSWLRHKFWNTFIWKVYIKLKYAYRQDRRLELVQVTLPVNTHCWISPIIDPDSIHVILLKYMQSGIGGCKVVHWQ